MVFILLYERGQTGAFGITRRSWGGFSCCFLCCGEDSSLGGGELNELVREKGYFGSLDPLSRLSELDIRRMSPHNKNLLVYLKSPSKSGSLTITKKEKCIFNAL